VKAAALAVALLATGCAVDAQSSLRRDISRIVPAGSKQQGTCDYASGFVEDAPPQLRCWFVVPGRTSRVTAEVDRNLRASGFAVSVRRPGGPAARIVVGQGDKSATTVALIAPGRPLFFQLGKGPIAAAHVGIDISLGRKQ
jgi:hypothetical protein